MTQRRAWLIDVWETLLTADFDGMLTAIAGIGPVPVAELRKTVSSYIDPVTVGELSVAEAFASALSSHGVTPSPQLTAAVAATQRGAFLTTAYVFPDAVSFITRVRRSGDLVALVSNCGDDTRPLLEDRGLLDVVDQVVLSCEIGVPKPDRGIYDHTVELLGVDSSEATLIDDQYAFCAGAISAGLHAIQLVRRGEPGLFPRSAIPAVRSFDEIM